MSEMVRTLTKSADWHMDGEPPPPEKLDNLVKITMWRARTQPDRLAYTFLVDGETEEENLSFAELDYRARAIAAELQAKNLVGDRVLVVLEPGLEYNAAVLGCMYAGSIAVPVYPPDVFRANRTLPRLEAIIKDAGAGLVLSSDEILDWAAARLTQNCRVPTMAVESIRVGCETQWDPAPSRSQELALLQYTSGSTGTPKGVMVTHASIMHNLRAIQRYVTANATGVLWLPPYHDFGLVCGVLLPLHTGRGCVLMSPLSFMQRPIRWLDAISRYRGTMSGAPNFGYELCIRKARGQDLAELDLSSWRIAANGAEPVRAETLDRFAEQFGPCGFRRDAFVPAYGMAESVLFITGRHPERSPTVRSFCPDALRANHAKQVDRPMPDSRRLVGCGPPIPDTEVRIVDPDSRLRLEPGQIGEIWVRGPSVARGYWNAPQETAHGFQARIQGDGNGRYLRTGDMGFTLDGEVFVTGRLKELIILGGRNYYPQDIEHTVQQSHPALKPDSAAAFSIEQDEIEQLVLVHEVTRPKRYDLQEVLTIIRQVLADSFDLFPCAVVLIPGGSLSKTSSGKTRRTACRERFLRGDLHTLAEWRAKPEQDPVDRKMDTPSTPLERRIAEIWSEVLGLPTVHSNDDFFALGGQSVAAVQLSGRVADEFGVELPLYKLFQHSTVAGVASLIEAARKQRQRTSHPITAVAAQKSDASNLLSFFERQLWFVDQLSPGNPAYNLPTAVRLRGAFHATVFRKSFQELLRRHEVLRAAYPSVDGLPLRCILPVSEVPIRSMDLRAVPQGDREEELGRQMREEARRRFYLAEGPLSRCVIYRTAEEEHVVLFTTHHIVSDGWSTGVFLRELAAVYEAYVSGQPSPLDTLDLSYSDFAAWQHEQLSDEFVARESQYWKDRLGGDPPLLDLPTDRPRPDNPTYDGAVRPFVLTSGLWQQICRTAQSERSTPFTMLAAALNVLLSGYAKQDEVSIGTIVANRTRSELESLVGLFANVSVLRTDLSGDPTFRELIARTAKVAVEAFSHQQLPFEKLVQLLEPQRHGNRSPLFQVALVLENMPLEKHTTTDLQIEPIPIDNGTSKYDMTWIFSEREGSLTGRVEYPKALFDEGTIDRMISSYLATLEKLTVNPEARVSTAPIPSREERRQLVVQWNATDRKLPDVDCVHQLIETRAEESSDAVAVTFEGRSLSYRQVDQRANRLAYELQKFGVGPDVPVALYLPRLPETLIAMLAVLKAGGAYVLLDPAMPADRLPVVIDNSKPRVILTQSRMHQDLPAHSAQVICLDEIREILTQEAVDRPPCRAKGENLAYIAYTSGSMGTPKGVMIPHRALANCLAALAERPGVTPSDVVLATTTLFFDSAMVELFLPMIVGARVVVATAETANNGDLLAAEIRRHGVTLLQGTPTTFRSLLASGWRPEPSVRVWCGGEAMTADLATQLLIGCDELWNVYGPTETTVWSTTSRITQPQDANCIGKPIANTQVYVLDENGRPAPTGVQGELFVAGLGLARGYCGQSDLTARYFLPNPFDPHPEARIYRTGDMARWRTDGTLEFVGRTEDQVKIRGNRVELAVSASEVRSHPAVRDAVVLAQEQEQEQDLSEKHLVAYVVPEHQNNEVHLESKIREHLSRRLPDYLVPTFFVTVDEIPRTMQGKLDRRRLPVPVDGRRKLKSRHIAPRDEQEAIVAEVWESLLGKSPIGATDHFFRLGGHSMLAVQVIAEIQRRTGRRLPLVALFHKPTVEHLARLLREPEKAPAETLLVPLQPEGTEHPLFFIHPLGGTVFCYRPLASLLGSDRPLYAVQAVGIDGLRPPLDSAEQMAADYIDVIRTVQPRGPYNLGGWSLGGIVAFEMARQLVEQGEQVALLALFDAGALPADRRADQEQLVEMLIDLYPHEDDISLEGIRAMSAEEQLDLFTQMAAQANLVLPDGDELAQNVFQVFQAGMQIMLEYHPKPYPGKISLFRCTRETLAFENRDPHLGWSPWVREVEVHTIPGDHIHMLETPSVDHLAEALSGCLDMT